MTTPKDWRDEVRRGSVPSQTTKSSQEVVYDLEYLIGFIQTLLQNREAEIRIEQVKAMDTLEESVRAEVVAMVERMMKNPVDLKDVQEMSRRGVYEISSYDQALRDIIAALKEPNQM